MKILFAFIMLFLATACFANESTGKDCSNIPGPGAQVAKIEQNCKKGDIIMLNKLQISKLCDFDWAIINYNQNDQYLCVYLGEIRDSRMGDF